MVINLTPEQFVSVYKALNTLTSDATFSADVGDLTEVFSNMECRLLDLLHEKEGERISTGFDKWLDAEKTKVEGLEEELEKIKRDVPNEVILDVFKPLTKKRRSKKTSRSKK